MPKDLNRQSEVGRKEDDKEGIDSVVEEEKGYDGGMKGRGNIYKTERREKHRETSPGG